MRVLKAKRRVGLVICLVLAVCMFAAFAACGGEPENKVDGGKTEYTVTFDSQGGSEIDPLVVPADTKAEKPDNPTKAGHIFKGWYLDLSDTDGGAFLFDETPITSDITLYALWQIRQYTVSYQDADGNAVEGLGAGVVDWGTILTKPDETAIDKEGYLIKWYAANGDIWDFETSKVTSNTTLTYRYVTTKDSYNASEVAEEFYPVHNKTNTDPESCQEHYDAENGTVYYTYLDTHLQQIVLNLELSTLDYGSVSITARSTDTEGDASKGGEFTQLRAYIKTDMGGNISYNDQPSSGYDPAYYYIQSTGVNKDLFSVKTEDGWSVFTFDLASLKFWNEAMRLDAFAFGFVSTTLGIEIQSVVFNKVDKDQEFTVSFVDSMGESISGISAQQIKWNMFATKPDTPADENGRVYTGEWLDTSGNVFDFETKRVRSNVTLTPEYTIEGKYSWTGEEIAKDFYAVYNASTSSPAGKAVYNGNSVFTYNNGTAGNGLEQIAIKNLNLEIGNYQYLTIKLRTVNFNGFEYNSSAVLGRIRVYLLTDQGGSVLANNLPDKDSYYYDFTGFDYTAVTTPVDISAKQEGGWYTVTVDLSAFVYYANGTALKGFAIGTTTSAVKALEVSQISLTEERPAGETYTVSFVDENGDPISAIATQNVPYGKAAAMPDLSLIPEKQDFTFDYWADADGNAFSFSLAVTGNAVLHPVYKENETWTGTTVSYAGQQIVDNFTASKERYGNTLTSQKALTLDEESNAVYSYDASANKALTGLDLGIRVHEGSKLVFTFSSSNQSNGYGFTQFKLGLAFRGEDPADTIKSTNANAHYFNYSSITAGTASGANDSLGISFSIAEDGTVTVTCDLYKMAQNSVSKISDGVDISYVEAFTFLFVEAATGTTTVANVASTVTFESIEFIDVQQKKAAE